MIGWTQDKGYSEIRHKHYKYESINTNHCNKCNYVLVPLGKGARLIYVKNTCTLHYHGDCWWNLDIWRQRLCP